MAELDEQESKAIAREGEPELDPERVEVYGDALRALQRAGIPFAMGGALALHAYTGIWRDTKDVDVFLKRQDLKAALGALAAAGFETNLEYEHWLAKARRGEHFIDLIFRSNNGRLEVDDAWFERNQPVTVAGVETRVIPVEEAIASKAYVAVRHRFDGADIVHLIRGVRGEVDWERVLARLGDDYELLLWHLLMFDFVYPGHAEYLPQELMAELFERVRARWSESEDARAFRGTLLDQFSFTVDIEDWGYRDARGTHFR